MKRILGLLTAVCIGVLCLVCRWNVSAREGAEPGERYLACIGAQSREQLRHRENLALWYNYALAAGEDLAGVDGVGLLEYEGVIALIVLPGSEETHPVYAEEDMTGFFLGEGSALPVGGQRIPARLEYRGGEEPEIPAEGECFRVYVLDRVLVYRVTAYPEGELPSADVCVLLLPKEGEEVTVVGIRVYPESDFGGKN